MFRRHVRIANALLAVVLASSLAACGGGGGHSTPPAPAPTATPVSCDSSSVARGPMYTRGHRRMTASGPAGTVPNRLWVKYASATQTASSVSSARVVKDVALKSGGGLLHALTFASATDAQSAARTLATQSNVVSVSPVHVRRMATNSRLPASDAVANDYLLDNVDQWYNYRTKVDTGTAATSAWTVAAANAGSAVKLAIIDTGIDETNTDINSKTVYKESVITSSTTNVQTISTGNGTVQDSDGHGTNVAGLAIAQVNNEVPSATPFDSTAFAGVAGVGTGVQLLAFRIFPPSTAANEDPTADTDDEAKAIDDAVTQGASVISMSLGGPQCEGADAGEEAAVEAAIAAGVVVVAAAGNEYPAAEADVVDFPAGYPGVIAVGASAVTDPTMSTASGATPVPYADITADTVASYSNSGATLVAPGGDENTAIPSPGDPDLLHWIEGYDTTTGGASDLQCENDYPSSSEQVCAVLFNGTSQATPQVAGTIALMESVHGGSKSLTPSTATTLLTSTAQAIPGVATARQGAGLLNAYAAVTAAHL